MTDKKKKTHESYGLLSITRTQSNKKINLFGSNIKHSNTIIMQLHRATVERDLHREFYYTDGNLPLFEIEMSPLQLANIITGMNVGSGYPVTIRFIEGKEIEDPSEVKYMELFEKEFKKKISNISSKTTKLLEKADEILKKRVRDIKKSDQEELVTLIQLIEQELKENLPFINTQFNEHMYRTIMEARNELEGFLLYSLQNKIKMEPLKLELETPKKIIRHKLIIKTEEKEEEKTTEDIQKIIENIDKEITTTEENKENN